MEGQPLTADALKAYFKTSGYVVYTIEDLFNDYMHILSKRVGKDLTQKTYRKYEIARDKFYQIISPKEPVSAITKAVIMDYQASMNRYCSGPFFFLHDARFGSYRDYMKKCIIVYHCK